LKCGAEIAGLGSRGNANGADPDGGCAAVSTICIHYIILQRV